MTRRRWIKLWTQETIDGTTCEELEPAERWVWIGFLCLAGDSPIPGTICGLRGVAFTDEQLAGMLSVSPKLLRAARDKMAQAGKVENNNGLLRVVNWGHYQDDAMRVWKHRHKDVTPSDVTPPDVTPQPDQTRLEEIRR